MATIILSSSLPAINLFKSTYPTGVSASNLRNSVLQAINVSKSNDVLEVALSTTPFTSFGANEYTVKTITAFVSAYQTADETVVLSPNDITYSIDVYFVDDVSV
jgi:hypothetical protein